MAKLRIRPTACALYRAAPRPCLKVLILFILLTVLFAGSTDVQANLWSRKRFNGKPSNGFWLHPSVYSYLYQQSVREGIGEWLPSSHVVENNLVEHASIPRGVRGIDVYIVSESPRYFRYGRTVFYRRLSSGKMETTQPNETWEMCKIFLFHDRIETEIPNDDDLKFRFVKFTAMHEAGHSLKLAHSDRDETVWSTKPLNNAPSVMSDKAFDNSSDPIQIFYEHIQPFDISEIQRKWGRRMRRDTLHLIIGGSAFICLFNGCSKPQTPPAAIGASIVKPTIKQIVLNSAERKLTLRTVSDKGLYGYRKTLDSLLAVCDAVVIGTPTQAFVDRSHYISMDPDGDPAEFWTIGPVAVQQVVYKKAGVNLNNGDSILVSENVGLITYPEVPEVVKLTSDACDEIIQGAKYILCLKRESTNVWQLINLKLGQFNIDGTDPFDDDYQPDNTNGGLTEKRQLRDALIQRFNLASQLVAPFPTPVCNIISLNQFATHRDLFVGCGTPKTIGGSFVIERMLTVNDVDSGWQPIAQIGTQVPCGNGRHDPPDFVDNTVLASGTVCSYRVRQLDGTHTSYYSAVVSVTVP